MMPVALRHGNLRAAAASIHGRVRMAGEARRIDHPVTAAEVILLRFKQSFEVNPWDDCFVV